MSDRSSYKFCSRGECGVSQSIASKAERMVRDAAKPIPAGETVKGQLRRAAKALGYRAGDWRVRAAWYGEASSWSAEAFEDLKLRYDHLLQKRAEAARRKKKKDQERIRQAQEEYRAIDERITRLETALGMVDPAFYGPDIDGFRAAALGYRAQANATSGEDRPMDEAADRDEHFEKGRERK